MPAPDSIELAATAQSDEGLKSILVGGNAVNLHAYLRSTFDIDLLILEDEAERWRSFFERHGYAVFHATANFIRMRFAADPTGALPVDLMLVDALTFQKIYKQSRACDIGNDRQLPIPDPLHLIAMKLHASRSPHRLEHGVDLQDVRHLIRAARIDVASPPFTEILNRYANEEIRARLLELLRSDDPTARV